VELNLQSEDKQIIDSFLDGNKSAFNIIVLKYQKRVYWTIRRMVVDHDDADDITQEVFVKLYGSLKDFRGESALFTYLYKIAINYSLNHIKKNKNKMLRESPIDNEFTDKYSDKDDAGEPMDSEGKNRLISEAILLLPDQQRAVFNMRFYDDMTYEEISSVLNKSVGGLKANYFHAFKKIQAFLKDKKLKGFID